MRHAWLTLVIAATVTTFTVTGVVVGVEPWYEPQYLIPLMGMCLGNTLTGLSLCIDSLLESFSERRHEVELLLSLGANRWEAARGMVQAAVRRGMVPILNAMTVVGIVSLPGMMTGQILAGADPLEAVKYQMVVMFMLAASTAIGCIVITWLAYRRLFNDRHQLRAERIVRT
jgi:putative ABC transport system permease protein